MITDNQWLYRFPLIFSNEPQTLGVILTVRPRMLKCILVKEIPISNQSIQILDIETYFSRELHCKIQLWCNILTCIIFHYLTICQSQHLPNTYMPVGCAVHAKWCTARFQEHTQMAILVVYNLYVCWKMGIYQNITPVRFKSKSWQVAMTFSIKTVSNNSMTPWFRSKTITFVDVESLKASQYLNLKSVTIPVKSVTINI